MELIETSFLMFIVFSFLGWIWESVIYSLIDKRRIVNRGFMSGPYIPIYGTGALIDLLILGNITDMVLLFFVSATLCTMVEYVASCVMEKLFNARWWDYYDMFWHLNGRICIEGFLAFGGLSVALVKRINPFTADLIGRLSPTALHITAGTLFVIFVTDFVLSVKQAVDFEQKVRKIAEMLLAAKDRMVAVYDTVVIETIFRKAVSLLTKPQKRMLRAFPAMRSVSYPGIIKSIRSVLPSSREKADYETVTDALARREEQRRRTAGDRSAADSLKQSAAEAAGEPANPQAPRDDGNAKE